MKSYTFFLLILLLLCSCGAKEEYYIDNNTLDIDTIVSEEKRGCQLFISQSKLFR